MMVFILGGLLALVLAATITVSIPGVRARVLSVAMRMVERSLPGDVTIEKAAWPSPGRLELTGVTWVDGADSLVVLQRLVASARLRALISRDLEFDMIVVDGLAIDVPAVTRRFDKDPGDAAAEPGSPPKFPRPGSLGGIPSVSVDSLSVSARFVRVDDHEIRDIEVVASADLSHGGVPRVRVDTLTARDAADQWFFQDLSVDADLSAPSARVDGHGIIAGIAAVHLEASLDEANQFSLVLSRPATPQPPQGVGLALQGRLTRRALSVQSIDFYASVHAPPVAELARVPGMAWVEGVPQLDGIEAGLGGTVYIAPHLEGSVECTIGRNAAGLEAGSFRLHYDGNVVTLENATFTFPEFSVAARATLERRALSLRSVVSAKAWHAGVAAAVELGDTIGAALSPITIHEDLLTLESMSEPQDEVVRYAPATGALRVHGLTVEADGGLLTIDAHVPSDGAGRYAVQARWEELPPAVARRLNVTTTQLESLRNIWRNDNPLELVLHGTLDGLPPTEVTAAPDFRLPGPRVLAPLLPDSTNIADLGPLGGRANLILRLVPDGPEVDLALAFDGTAWIDSSHFVLRVRAERTAVQEARLAALGLSLDATASFAQGELEAAGRLGIADSELLRRVAPTAPDVSLSLDGTARGSFEKPLFDVTFESAIDGGDYVLPLLQGELHRDASHLAARVFAPEGLRTRSIELDSVTIDYQSLEADAVVPGRVTIDATGDRVAWRQSTRLLSRAPWNIVLETLEVDIDGRNLTLARSTAIEWRQESGTLRVDDLNLSGSLGTVAVRGRVGPDTTDVDAGMSIELPAKPPALAVPDPLWPSRVDVTISAASNRVDAVVGLFGFSLPDGRPGRLEATLHGDSTVAAHVAVHDSAGAVVDVDARFPVTVSLYPPRLDARNDTLRADVVLERVPLAFFLLDVPQEQVARMDGRITVGGTPASPSAYARMQLAFPDWPKMSQYALELEGILSPDANAVGVPASGILQRALPSMPTLQRGGIVAAMQVRRAQAELASGKIAYPLTVALHPPQASVPEGQVAFVDLHSVEIEMHELDPLLPMDISLDGACRLDFSATGAVGNADLKGRFVAENFEASASNRGAVTARANIEVSGSTLRPKIDGDITVESALLLLPEEIKQLHPAQGDARLWVRQDSAHADGDSAAAVPEEDKPQTYPADIDVSIHIPNDFRIRGRGLDLELQGDLNISDDIASPNVIGELRAIKGSLIVLGRSLQLERGTVSFYGHDATDPSLDILLSTEVGGNRISILIAGTVRKPKVTLKSLPEMEENDIVAVLLFGQSFDDLNDDQADFVYDRTAEMFAALGVAALRKNMSAVDVVSYQGAGTGERANTVTLGKYINPDVLLSYIYSTEDPQGRSFVSLEYFLPKRFKIDTVLGRKSQAGIGVGWARDY